MISLTPIHKAIQKRLFEKSRILGRQKTSNINEGKKDGEPLNHAQLSTRSTFLRMTSGQVNPVILMGGALKENGTMYAGYDDVYGARTYTVGGRRGSLESDFYDNFDNYEYDPGEPGKPKTINQNGNRPMPGVRNVDIVFKGGERALREATIQWTCWDWDELDILTPHFLSHGKTVMVEWGWVYNKKSLEQLPNFLTFDEGGNRFLDADAFDNYQEKIFDVNGDFDMMVGIVKNFEYTTRADGGFDCTTILTSVGASILDNPQPNEVVLDPNITYNLSLTDNERVVQEKLIAATAKSGGETDAKDKNPLLDLNTSVTLKLFVKNIDKYLTEKIMTKESVIEDNVAFQPNKYILGVRKLKADLKNYIGKNIIGNKIDTSFLLKRDDVDFWVRWGWFEDNVLSKFLSVTANNAADYNPVVTSFRSIERKIDVDGNPAKKQNGQAIYESVRIKNHKALQTTNITKYILPGKFFAQEPKKFEISGKTVKLDGDSKYIRRLATIVNGKENFSKFSAGTQVEEREEITYEGEDRVIDGVLRNFTLTKEKIQESVEKHGFLRNMLINTKVIKDAFGVNATDDSFSVESVNVVEAIQNMFNILNQELNYWSYNIVVDEVETSRAKIVDEQTVNFDFSRTAQEQRSKLGVNGEVVTDISDDEGVFFFPVWRSDSIVKSQNITATVPDEMQLSIMYGANMDQLKEFSNPGSQFSTKEGVFVGGLYNQQQDLHKSGLDIAFRNPATRKIGVRHGFTTTKENFTGPVKRTVIDDASQPLQANAGDDIEIFLKENSDILEETFKQRLEKLDDQLRISEQQRESIIAEATGTQKFDSSVPPPFASRLSDEEISRLLEFETERRFGNLAVGELTRLFNRVFNDSGEMLPAFKSSVSYLTTQHGINKQAETPLLIPLELSLEIDGIGGIYPGNSFHSTYLPTRYQKSTVFQAFDVNHTLDSSKWTTTITGKMRSTMSNIFDGFATLRQLEAAQFENYLNKAQNNENQIREQAAQSSKDRIQAEKIAAENRRRHGLSRQGRDY